MALGIFVLEAQIPVPVPIPGIKLGLANIITVAAVFLLGWKQALAVLLIRIVLGSMYTGFANLPYSLVGGVCSILTVLAIQRILRRNQLWIAGAIGGMVHNLGQIAVAILLTQTPALLVYLPALILSGLLTGCFTGLCTQLTINQIQRGL